MFLGRLQQTIMSLPYHGWILLLLKRVSLFALSAFEWNKDLLTLLFLLSVLPKLHSQSPYPYLPSNPTTQHILHRAKHAEQLRSPIYQT
ncbi:hypothetical protein C8R48DRAFT_698985 [Suillus tomentosus]|nr:hypothetical protein C8R48DRAFT_698985 [Suillus tomentosus]